MRVARPDPLVDPSLLDRVISVGGESTKLGAATLAVKGFTATPGQRHVSELFGKLEWDPIYDYKTERSRP